MYNRTFTLLVLACLILAPFSGCLSDGGTEIPNEVRGTLYTSSGAPAANAQVALYAVNHVPDSTGSDTGSYTTQTNASGNFALTDVPDGQYNVVAAGAGNFAFRDSVQVTDGTAELADDTLRAPGTITATVQLQPMHSPQSATVQVLGTEYYSNVAANGKFTLTLPQGTHRLRVQASQSEYTPLFVSVTIVSAVHDTLTDPLIPFYTGIPAVTGLTAVADSSGRVQLRWKKADYATFRRYLIYRVPTGSLSQGTVVSTTVDTVFTDTVFAQTFGKVAGANQYAYTDTLSKTFDYRVRVQSQTDEIGLAFGLATATARPPALRNGIPSALNFTATGDSGGKVTLRWNQSHPNDSMVRFKIYRASGSPSSVGSLLATIRDTIFVDTIFAQSRGAVGEYDYDDTTAVTFHYRIIPTGLPSGETGPVAGPRTATTQTPALRIASGRWHKALENAPFSARYRHQAFVFKDKLWVTGGTGGPGTDGATGYSNDLWSSPDGISWQKMRDSLYGSITVFQNKLYHIRNDRNTNKLSVWVSDDGSIWNILVGSATLPGFPQSQFNGPYTSAVAFQNKLWIFGGYNNGTSTPLKTVHSSSDGVTWTLVDPQFDAALNLPFTSSFDQYNQRQDRSSNRITFGGKIWATGGYNYMYYSWGANPYAWSSADGQNWTHTAAGFQPRYAHALAEHDGKMWVIGGLKVRVTGSSPASITAATDVWSSTDGTTWTEVDFKTPFQARHGQAAVSFQGKLWVIGGADASGLANEQGTPKNDIWYYE